MRKIITITALLLAVVFSRADAQDKQVTGKITSSDGSTLPGVTVIVTGTTIGTTSDMDGMYRISVPADATTLKFILVGMKTKEVAIGSSSSIDVVMETDVLRLDEVVVTALGIDREKKALGYSTQNVGGDQLNNSGSGNALSELSGKVAGLEVINSSGDPGAGTYIQMRGVTTLTGTNQPLMVVDGIPIDNSSNFFDPTNLNGGGLGGVSIDNRGIDINPSDIESITVLKGPAATALYGIEAASGALIITTKKGHAGGKKGISVELNSSASMDKANQLPTLQNIYGQGNNYKYYSPTSAGSNKKFSWGPHMDSLAWDGNSNVWDSHGNIVPIGTAGSTPITPYNPEDFFVTGNTYNNSIAVSGSNDNSGYRMSIGNMSQTGIIPLTDYYKNTVSLSGETNISRKLRVSGTVTYIKSSQDKAQQGSNTSGVMLGLLRTPHTFDNSNGSSHPATDSSAYVLASPLASGWAQRNYRGGPGYDNPYWTINMNPFHQDLDRVYGSMQGDYKLYDWMTLTYRIGGDIYTQSQKEAYNIFSNAGIQSGGAGGIFLNDYYNSQYNSDFIINMKKKFNDDFSGSLILGQNYFTQYGSVRQMAGYTFAIPTFFDLSNSQSFQSAEGEAGVRRSAWYGEGELDYKSQLYLTLTGRDETTSTLSASNDNFFYPSASLSWVFTESLGLSSNKTFPYGKFRISYAGVGKDALAQENGTYYKPATVNDGFTGGVSFPFNGFPGYSTTNGLVGQLGNPNLVPEHTNSFETGFDLSFLQNRISLNATYYSEKSTNVIFAVPTSYATGWSYAIFNAATLTNHGIELSLNTTPVKLKNGFQWDLNFNWSKNTNSVDSLYNGVKNQLIAGFQNGAIYAVAGQPFGVIYGSAYQRSNPTDQSSAILIDDNKSDAGYGMPTVATQTTALGNIQPDWIGSITTNFTFKGFTLGAQIDIRHGGKIWNGTQGALDYFGTGGPTASRGSSQAFAGVLGHLNASGQVVHYAADGVTELAGPGSSSTPTVVLGEYYWQNIGSSFIGPTEPDVQDGGYVKLRQLSLTYSLPTLCVQKMHLQKVSLTFFMNNIILSTKYTGVDPETSLVGPQNAQGLDYFNNPGIKSYGLRLNVGI